MSIRENIDWSYLITIVVLMSPLWTLLIYFIFRPPPQWDRKASHKDRETPDQKLP